MDLVLASNNKHKLEEIQAAVGKRYTVLSLSDIACFDQIPEDHDTLEENAFQKAYHIYDKYGKNCFADDTGLEIEALDGRPGVYSARYAGEHCSSEDNINKILSELEGISNRKACFRTVIALILNGKEYSFEGRVNGKILTEKQGEKGFGYDPIFQPDGSTLSFAQMPLEEKNKVSHRGKAMEKLMEFLTLPSVPPKEGSSLPKEGTFKLKQQSPNCPKGKNPPPSEEKLSISILGAGNIAWHFAMQLHAHGYRIRCIYNHRLENAKLLANRFNTFYTDNLASIPHSDLYLLSVKDDSYRQLISEMTGNKSIYIHTSGCLEMEMLKPLSPNYGVLYPFQTLTKEKTVSFQIAPLCIEASNKSTLNILSALAKDLQSPCYTINSQQRAYLHLCGVFASNFTNALYGIAEQIAKEQQLDFEIIKPLIMETARKIKTLSPAEAQTGPAKRNDQTILQKHIELLTNPLWKEVYKLMSNIIIIQQ